MSFIKRISLHRVVFSFPAFALFTLSPVSHILDTKSSAALQVKFLGGDNHALFFDVKYENKTGSTFKLLALDETGAACFQNKYSARDFDKKIKVPRLTDTDYVIFLIRSAKENIQLSYKVKVTTKVVDETVFLKNRELVSYK